VTPSQLELCRLVGLVEESAPGVFVLTRSGRTLLGEKPPAPRVESNAEWLARIAALRDGDRRAL
jgi:hypothetical protein